MISPKMMLATVRGIRPATHALLAFTLIACAGTAAAAARG